VGRYRGDLEYSLSLSSGCFDIRKKAVCKSCKSSIQARSEFASWLTVKVIMNVPMNVPLCSGEQARHATQTLASPRRQAHLQLQKKDGSHDFTRDHLEQRRLVRAVNERRSVSRASTLCFVPCALA
jgi:hypothetical protein